MLTLERPLWTEYIDACLQNGLFCDIFFQCDDALVGAHRIVVASASHYLADLLKGSNQDPVTIILPGISGQTMHLYLRLIYGEKIVLGKSIYEELLVKFKGIDVALGITYLRLSIRNTKGKVLNDLDLNQNVNKNFGSNAVKCAACISQMEETETPQYEVQQNGEGSNFNAINLGGNTMKETQLVREEVNYRDRVRYAACDNQMADDIDLGGDTTEENESEMQQSEKAFEATEEQLAETLDVNGNSLNINKEVNDNKILGTENAFAVPISLSDLNLENMKKSVKVLLIQNENFNKHALKQMKHLKSVTKKLFPCVICDKQLTSKWNYKYHMKRYHDGEKGEKELFTCKSCNKNFISKGSLYVHDKRVHEQNTRFICNVCKKPWVSKADLDKHNRVHSLEKPYSCSICFKKFNQISNLNSHRKDVHKRDM